MKRAFQNTRSTITKASGLVGLLAVFASASTGCRQRALTEVYVENMAGEIRTLEDLVYEYDAEYRSLENEVDDLRRTNADLQARLEALPGNSGPAPANRKPRNSSGSNSILNLGNGANLEHGGTEEPEVYVPPRITPKAPPVSPSNKPNQLNGGANPTSPQGIEAVQPAPVEPAQPTKEDEDINLIPPPLNKPIQYNLRSETATPRGLPSLANVETAIHQHVSVPQPDSVRLASATGAVHSIKSNEPTRPSVPVDTKVRAIELHPTLCRGHNFDEKPGDDGLFLVVTPKNSAGESINPAGTLTIVVEEEQGENSARIGRWEFTPTQLEELLEPIGAGQGFHVKLPWQQQIPTGSTVEVYVRYAMNDGTVAVDRKTIQLRKPKPSQTTWMPR